MHINRLFGFFADMHRAISIGFFPVLKVVLSRPSLLFDRQEISRLYMSFVWEVYGPGLDESSKVVKETLISTHAKGVVLDIGAGYGHLLPYLDRNRVKAYIALEPNVRMHASIRAKAAEFGFSEEEGNFVALPYGAEEVQRVVGTVRTWRSDVGRRWCCLSEPELAPDAGKNREAVEAQVIDTIVLIRALCSIPKPHETLNALVNTLLMPGGQLLFLEHVRSPKKDVAWWQDVVAPIWRRAFDGCIIGLDGVGIIKGAAGGDDKGGEGGQVYEGGKGGWKEMETWGVEGDDEENLFWHQVGRCVKA